MRNMKRLTIDKIAPKWSKFLDLIALHGNQHKRVRAYQKRHELSIVDTDRCVVGEAYKFSPQDSSNCLAYDCGKCYEFPRSLGFQHSLGFIPLECDIGIPGEYFKHNNKEYKKENWRETETVKEFEKHWNENHT